MKKHTLTLLILAAVVVGALSGVAFKGTVVIGVAVFAAEIFTRMLQMIIVPLVFTSIVSGMFGVGTAENLGRLGIKTLLYYACTTTLAITTGMILVNLIQPGVGVDLGLAVEAPEISTEPGGLLDVFRRMIPTNIIAAAAEGEMLPIIIFCVFFGIGIAQLPPSSSRETLENVITGAFHVMMRVTHIVFLFAPIGIWGYLAKIMAETGFSALVPLGRYALTVVLGLGIHACVTMPLILFFLARVNPLTFAKHMSASLLTAFSTASSSVALPLTLECIESNARVSNRISSFVIPLGATVNMDGTALYQGVAVLFIAQAYGIPMNFASQFTILITALLASVGTAAVPMAGLVMMSIILKAVGLPLEGVGLVLAVDRVLDMLRTMINVWGDSCGTLLIGKWEGEVGEWAEGVPTTARVSE